MPRYDNGKIYAIRSHQTDNVYIGSTCDALHKRLYAHREFKRRFDAGESHYTTSFDILSYDDHYIELVENCPCSSKIELHRREGQIIRDTENCVNKYIAGRTSAEYRRDNAEQIREREKAYRQANSEHIREKRKAYYKANSGRLLAQQKEYKQANAEQIKAQRKEYRQANAEQIREKHACPCGGRYTTVNKNKHYKTIKHMKFEETNKLT